MTDELNFGCSDEFAELCALAAAGELSTVEEERLQSHLALCSACALLLNQYHMVATAGMAHVAAYWAESETPGERLKNPDRLKARIVTAVTPMLSPQATDMPPGLVAIVVRGWRLPVAASAAALLIAVGGHYLRGEIAAARRARSLVADSVITQATLRLQLADAKSRLSAVNEQLLAANRAADDAKVKGAAAQADLLVAVHNADALRVRADGAEQDIRNIQETKATLEARIQSISADRQQQRSSWESLVAERDALAQKLSESESSLQSLKQELKLAQDERQRVASRAANLETDVQRLSAQMSERDETVRQEEQYLASDRDIRELMGARQLHIADVFDVDALGKTRKPYGRVFYTRGRSLIFYGFDLDQQPGYRVAKAFQAWGRLRSGDVQPVSLGIFYLDNENKRRWTLQFDDPKVLEEINAVFVTVEPQGGSKRPTNKPFLLTYLHTTSLNHP